MNDERDACAALRPSASRGSLKERRRNPPPQKKKTALLIQAPNLEIGPRRNVPALESDVRARVRVSGVTSSAANHFPAFSVPFTPNKANGERVRNGCKSSDITPLLCTASAVSVAAEKKKSTTSE